MSRERAANKPLERSIRARFPSDGYVQYHARRYAAAIALVRGALDRPSAGRVLDVGRSVLTTLLHEHLGVPVDSLGFDADTDTPTGKHYHFNLNDTEQREGWRRGLPAYDAIVLAEVIEHLHVSPVHVLAFLGSALAPSGRLILQTPNAVALHKRIRMLLGQHPFDRIALDPTGPAHFREYTPAELVEDAGLAGLTPVLIRLTSHFDYRYRFDSRAGIHPTAARGGLMNLVYAAMPPSLRRGITIVLQRSDEAPPHGST